MRFFLFPLSILYAAGIPFIEPPQDWEIAFPNTLSSCIQIGFLGKGSSPFRPSINLATEEVFVGLKQYVKAARAMHLEEPGMTWRDLGKFTTQSGEGRLIEITRESPLGVVKMLQLLLVKDNTAYIATGAASKSDFLACQAVFTKTFQTLTIADHLFSLLPEEHRAPLETFFKALATGAFSESEKKALWVDLQQMVLEKKDMGGQWQFLVLKEGREKLYPEGL